MDAPDPPDPATGRRQVRSTLPRRTDSVPGRFNPMNGSWPMVCVDVVVVIGLTTLGWWISDRIAEGAWRWPTFVAVGGVLIFVCVAIPLRVLLMGQRRQAEQREQMLIDDGQRRDFERRLGRGLDMAEDVPTALDVGRRAFAELVPSSSVDVLLADSSQAHLSLVSSYRPDPNLPGCDVLIPHACPAVRRGHPLRFDDSAALDACPHLAARRDSAGGAVCVPLSVSGSTIGVLHAVHARGDEPATWSLDGLEIVAQRMGARVGMLAAMARSETQASTDPLTGLLNRRSLDDAVRALTRSARSFAVLIADLDHFKALNDTHGHETGDRALRLFSRLMTVNVRAGDLVARFGGEEFVIVFPGLDAAGAAEVFDRVRLDLAAALSDGRTPGFTVSAGVVDTNDAARFEDLIRLADQQLLLAKRMGRDRTLVGPAEGPVSVGDPRPESQPVS